MKDNGNDIITRYKIKTVTEGKEGYVMAEPKSHYCKIALTEEEADVVGRSFLDDCDMLGLDASFEVEPFTMNLNMDYKTR